MRTTMTRGPVMVFLSCLVALMAAISGCTKTSPVSTSPNRAPETTLTARGEPAPGGARQVLLQWIGSDEDGSVDHYLVRLDTLDWCEVTRTESVFVFPGRTKHPSLVDEEETHSFTVKAVDDRGQEDPTPAVVWFTPRNELPETEIVDGPASVTGPMVFIEWAGTDPDGVIAAYDYRLSKWEYGEEWVQVIPDPIVAPSVTVGPDVTTVMFGPLAGLHKFEVWATDNEGGADPTPAVCEFTCNPELAGALLSVSTNFIGTHRFRGPVWPNAYNIPVDIFQEHLAFNWTADASAYGGEVVGYRHAFDDTSSWPDWSLEDRTFEVTPEPGQHSLYVSVLDNANVITRARFFIDVSEVGLCQYILLVDDYDLWEHNPAWGTDADRDAFYDSLLCCYERPIIEWNPEEHMVGGNPQPPDVVTLASASTVIWYADSDADALRRVFDPYGQSYSLLAAYVRVGGNLLLCGSKLLGTITGGPYPMTFTAEDTTSAAVFVRDYLRIDRADHSGESADPDAPWDYGYCMHGAVPTPAGEALGFEPVYVDTGDCDMQPGKWWFYCDPPLPGYYHCGLSVEKLVSFQGTSLEIYATDSYLNPNYEGETSVVLYLSSDNHGNVCYMGFPLYYLKTFQVKAFFDELLPLFGEAAVDPTGIGE